MARLWKNEDGTREGKYLVLRRDGSVPDWPYFVLGAGDPAAPSAIRAYALRCRALEMDPEYVDDLLDLADEFQNWKKEHGAGDPDAPKHREDDPLIVGMMRKAHGS